jgi:hypothetical protein
MRFSISARSKHDRGNAERRHAGQRRAPQVMGRPSGNPEAPGRMIGAGLGAVQDGMRHRGRRQRARIVGAAARKHESAFAGFGQRLADQRQR